MKGKSLQRFFVALIVSVLALASAQAPAEFANDLVVVARTGATVQLRNAVVSYRPDGPAPRRDEPEFSLHYALEDGLVQSIVLDRAAAEGPVWRVVLRDGRIMIVTGGEVRFEGDIVVANGLGLVGFLSVLLGPDPATGNPFVSVTFIG